MRRAALIWLFAALLPAACARPDTQEQFVRADKAADGVYIFDFELEGNGSGPRQGQGERRPRPKGNKKEAAK